MAEYTLTWSTIENIKVNVDCVRFMSLEQTSPLHGLYQQHLDIFSAIQQPRFYPQVPINLFRVKFCCQRHPSCGQKKHYMLHDFLSYAMLSLTTVMRRSA